jgi:hypothetical protein
LAPGWPQVGPRLTPGCPRVCFQRLKLRCHESPSNFTFSFNLCRYIKVAKLDAFKRRGTPTAEESALAFMVGRCRLTLSNPR